MNSRLRRGGVWGLTLGVLAVVPAANAVIIDFETDSNLVALVNGFNVEDTATPFFNLSNGITTTGSNAGAAVFDSTPNVNAADPDLWINTGNILILQNSGSSQTGNVFDTPNDDANGGTFFFDFDLPVEMQSILLGDINGNNQSAIITLIDGQGFERIYDVPSEWTGDIDQSEPGLGTLDLTTLADQAGFLSTATATEDLGFNAQDVVSMTVWFQGSGSLDNIEFNIIPAPGVLALLGLSGLAARRRRRA